MCECVCVVVVVVGVVGGVVGVDYGITGLLHFGTYSLSFVLTQTIQRIVETVGSPANSARYKPKQ